MNYDRVSALSTPTLLLLSVVTSVILSIAITATMSMVFHGHIATDYIITGIVASAIVAAIVVTLILGMSRERELSRRELRDTTKQLRSWLECSPVCTKILDPDFHLRYMSTAGIRYLKIDDIDAVYGAQFPMECYPDSTRDDIVRTLEEAKRTGKALKLDTPVFGGGSWCNRS